MAGATGGEARPGRASYASRGGTPPKQRALDGEGEGRGTPRPSPLQSIVVVLRVPSCPLPVCGCGWGLVRGVSRWTVATRLARRCHGGLVQPARQCTPHLANAFACVTTPFAQIAALLAGRLTCCGAFITTLLFCRNSRRGDQIRPTRHQAPSQHERRHPTRPAGARRCPPRYIMRS